MTPRKRTKAQMDAIVASNRKWRNANPIRRRRINRECYERKRDSFRENKIAYFKHDWKIISSYHNDSGHQVDIWERSL